MLRFALIGDGTIAKYHKEAIKHVGGELLCQNIIDTKYAPTEYLKENPGNHLFSKMGLYSGFGSFISHKNNFDYIVIASPSHLHRQQIKNILDISFVCPKIICEKPAFLPWEPIIDNDRINIVLQLRYLPDLPKKADLVSVRFVRDEAYFKSWKGDARNTGGLFYNLFIHGIDLALQLNADFDGKVASEGEQERWIGTKWSWPKEAWFNDDRFIDNKDKIDILNIDTQACYNRMYGAILEDRGIKPNDLFYLNWILSRNSEIFGYGQTGLNQTITIKNEL